MVLIVGGGFTGIGVALGLKRLNVQDFLVIEKNNEILEGTSGSSFRLVHSGVRHLQRLSIVEFIRSKKASKEFVEEFSEGVQPVQVYAHIPLASRVKWLLKPFEKAFGSFLVEKRFFNTRGIYFTWTDHLIVSLESIKNIVHKKLGDRIKTGVEVKEIANKRIKTNLGERSYGNLVLACYPAFMSELKNLYAWNIVCEDLFIPEPVCVGFPTESGRYIFSVRRDGGSSFGTWYSYQYPSAEDVRMALHEIKEKFGAIPTRYQVEVGTMPSVSGRVIERSYIKIERDVYKIFPAKFTSSVTLGRALAQKLSESLPERHRSSQG